MIAERLVAAVETAIALLALLFLWHGPYKTYRTDLLRERLFVLRNDLFDYAAAGNLSFDDPAYWMLRSTLNGFIRFAHRTSLIGFLAFFITTRRSVRPAATYNADFIASMAKLPLPVREKLNTTLNQMHFATIEHLLMTSLMSYVLVIPVAFVMLVTVCRRFVRVSVLYPLRDSLARRLSSLDAAALDMGTMQSI